MNPRRRSPYLLVPFGVASVLALVTALTWPAPAQDKEQEQAQGPEDDTKQSVARVAGVDGYASFARGDDPENWQEAEVNLPLTAGDRVYTAGDGRMELQAEGARVFLSKETQLTALDVREDIRQLSVGIGTASFKIHRLSEGQVFEVDLPNVSITFRGPGTFRIDVDKEGNTRVVLFEGSAVAVAGGGQVDLNGGESIRVQGIEEPRYDIEAVPKGDDWDRWVDGRAKPKAKAVSLQYASDEMVGVDELDESGSWEEIPEYGHAWTPRGVAADWAPYRDGRWLWQDPWGWTWLARERWGWAPYHYGSWNNYQNRWFWIPEPRGAHFVHYSPARVAFAGGGPGLMGPGGPAHIGWFPIHPRDRFIPWWGHRNFTPPRHESYFNHGFMSVVSREHFVGGGFLRDRFVRDTRILRDIGRAPFMHGPLPLLPTRDSIRFGGLSGRRGDAIRPPKMFLDRAVVTRIAPPLRPPTFDAKLGFIRQNKGRPVDRITSEKISFDHFKGGQTAVGVRPAVIEGGKTSFKPRNESAGNMGKHLVQPVTVPTGRTLSTNKSTFSGFGSRGPGGGPGGNTASGGPVGQVQGGQKGQPGGFQQGGKSSLGGPVKTPTISERGTRTGSTFDSGRGTKSTTGGGVVKDGGKSTLGGPVKTPVISERGSRTGSTVDSGRGTKSTSGGVVKDSGKTSLGTPVKTPVINDRGNRSGNTVGSGPVRKSTSGGNVVKSPSGTTGGSSGGSSIKRNEPPPRPVKVQSAPQIRSAPPPKIVNPAPPPKPQAPLKDKKHA